MNAYVLPTALFLSCLAAPAFAGEQGTINQANPLDATLRFYPHPAHLYLSNQPPHALGEHPAVIVKRLEAQGESTQPPNVRPHPALLGRATKPPANVAQSPAGPPSNP